MADPPPAPAPAPPPPSTTISSSTSQPAGPPRSRPSGKTRSRKPKTDTEPGQEMEARALNGGAGGPTPRGQSRPNRRGRGGAAGGGGGATARERPARNERTVAQGTPFQALAVPPTSSSSRVASESSSASSSRQEQRPPNDLPPHSHSHPPPHLPHLPHTADPNPRSRRAPRPTQQAPSTSSRRARFNPALSTSTTSLVATSASFVPPSQSSAVAPSPVNQTLLARLTSELTKGTYECAICVGVISKTTPIHSCSTCYTSFHLSCIHKWAERSVEDSRERAELLSARGTQPGAGGAGSGAATGTTTPQQILELGGVWRCPSCQASSGSEMIPKHYRCFCSRVKDPTYKPNFTPHSCGQQCSKPRPDGCNHPDMTLCHPGPCPPCGVVLDTKCHCGKKDLKVRCSSLNNSIAGPGGISIGMGIQGGIVVGKEELLSCKDVCGKLMDCGLHRCERICHSGEEGECLVLREKICFCGKGRREESCGDGSNERVQCCRPRVGEEGGEVEKWEGEWGCERICDVPFDCSKHTCSLPCHPHTSSTPLPCPFSPSTLTTCPCTLTPLSSLLSTPRKTCLDPIPTCSSKCPRILECGHQCHRPCHLGPCLSCDEMISIVCRCGSTKTTKRCGERSLLLLGGWSTSTTAGGEADEFTCDKICRAMRNCGRHECGRKCCPLAYQEAIRANKNKGRRGRQATEQFEAESDPLRLHVCQRVCGRKLSCAQHTCERQDHKGPCPPCLQAGFDELVCHCGGTVLLPPIACNAKMDCRLPCIRAPPCGHPQMPHACHEEPACPPCPFLMLKECACKKKQVPNIRCSKDSKTVSCGTPCGKLLRCGFHRCRKVCHLDGECEACDQICLKPRALCFHPCPDQCHAPSSCSIATPCPLFIEVSCACGHLKQRARCATSADRPEGNRGRNIKCTDACTVAKRNLALATALGIEKREPRVKEVEYTVFTLSFYSDHPAWCQGIETQLIEFVQGDKPALHLPVMKHPQRQFTHELAEKFDLRSESLDEDPKRSVMVHRTSTTGIPTPNLTDALAAQKKGSSGLLSFGSLRRTLPERAPVNAVFLEGVLGYDEAMLSELLRPSMRALNFKLTWVTADDVLVTFDSPPTDLENRLSSIQFALRTLSEDTGFCSSIETVCLSEDGKITRGSWTPVSGASRTTNLDARGVFSPNAFAALSAGGTSVVPAPRIAQSWGAAGTVVGAGLYRPPRAVVAPYLEERPTPAPLPPKVETPPEEIPDSWEDEVEAEPEPHA